MATQRDNPYGAFNFIVSLGDTGRRGPDRRRLLRRQRPRHRGQVLRVPQRQREGEHTSARSPTRNKHRRRHAQARPDRRSATCSTGSRPSARATLDPRTVTITLLDEARAAGRARWVLQQRPAEEVDRADAGRQGRRRGGDGGAAPGRRADRLQVADVTVGLQLGAPGVYRSPDRVEPALDAGPAGRRRVRRGRAPRAGRRAGPGRPAGRTYERRVRRLRAPTPGAGPAAAVRGAGVLRPGRRAGVGRPGRTARPRRCRRPDEAAARLRAVDHAWTVRAGRRRRGHLGVDLDVAARVRGRATSCRVDVRRRPGCRCRRASTCRTARCCGSRRPDCRRRRSLRWAAQPVDRPDAAGPPVAVLDEPLPARRSSSTAR